MTCVPDGLIKKLEQKEFTLIGIEDNRRPSARMFIKQMKHNNKKTYNVSWQNNTLTDKELDENYERINSIELDKIHNGYLCSSCDPLLLLYCELFFVGIDILFNGTPLTYRNTKFTNRVLQFSSNSSHFS